MSFQELFAGYWWLLFPLGGMVGGGFKALWSSRERAHERKIGLYKLQHPEVAGLDVSTHKPVLDAASPDRKGYSDADVAKSVTEHDAINKRWLSYELDIANVSSTLPS